MTVLRIALVIMVLGGIGLGPLVERVLDRAPVAPASANAAASPTLAAMPATQPSLVRTVGRSGFWRLGQDHNGVWWFVSPDGRLEFLNTVTTVMPYQRAKADGVPFVSRDYSAGTTDAGDLDAWSVATLARVKSAGFKGIGAWSSRAFHNLDVPITRDLNIWQWISGPNKRLYSPGWTEAARNAVDKQVLQLRDNRNLVGFYTDNELDWSDANSGPRAYFDFLPAADPNRRQVVTTIRSLWPTIEQFNAAWGTALTDFADLDAWQHLPGKPKAAYDVLYSRWLYELAREYFSRTSAILRELAPNHLILGVRFRGYAPPEVVAASRGLTDAQSINYYVADALLDEQMFRMMYESSGQPIIITEYSFHAIDGRSGNRNAVGFSAQVLDQAARAQGYRDFTKRLAAVPWIIGADWFQWNDEPASGRTLDGEDVNFGIVDIDDRPYEPLAAAVIATTPKLNGIHASSHAAADAPFRKMRPRPAFQAPYLAKPPTLNGEPSDWPADARIPGITRTPGVGQDRLPASPPEVRLAWNEAGLYASITVFDTAVDATPADGWWWTRDSVELWISTRPTRPSQTTYDEFSHQFFIVPRAAAGPDGRFVTVGQWHRQGDALTGRGNLVPHPQVQSVARVLADRYTVELFIPAAALNGFDPQSELAFNVHVQDWQTATHHFWSAPKEAMTNLRPGTWGALRLAPPTRVAER